MDPQGDRTGGLQEFMDLEFYEDTRMSILQAFHGYQRVPSPPKCINKNTPTLNSRLFIFIFNAGCSKITVKTFRHHC